MATDKLSTTVDVPLPLDSSPKLSSNEIKSGPLSLEMFNCAASDLETKGIINLKNITGTSLRNHQNLFKFQHVLYCK